MSASRLAILLASLRAQPSNSALWQMVAKERGWKLSVDRETRSVTIDKHDGMVSTFFTTEALVDELLGIQQ